MRIAFRIIHTYFDCSFLGINSIPQHGVFRCNAILPGMTATEAVKKHLSEDFRTLFLRHIPLKKIGLPEEIAAGVVYFASDESSYTTGQILTISGGFGLATPIYGDVTSTNASRT